MHNARAGMAFNGVALIELKHNQIIIFFYTLLEGSVKYNKVVPSCTLDAPLWLHFIAEVWVL